MIRYIFTTSLVLFFFSLHSQIDSDRIPYSFEFDLSSHIPVVEVPAKNWNKEREKLLKMAEKNDKPFTFGVGVPMSIQMERGQWRTLKDGRKIWRIEIHSPSAKTLNVTWDKFYIPKGASLFVYNKDQSELIGAYTSKENHPAGILSSWPITGDHLIIEYNAEANVKELPTLHIGTVIHGLIDHSVVTKDLNNSGDCNYDVGCSIGSDIDKTKDHLSRSVGLLLLNGSSFCSSCLINNTAQDREPYVLTANHCMASTNAANVSVRFDWISPNPDCGTSEPSTDNPTMMILNGTSLLASNADSDVALLRLDDEVPQEWNRVFAGWDRTGRTPEFVFGIHHPAGDIMKVCREEDEVIKNVIAGAECWEIQEANEGWEIGVTEVGSSGSPLFDPKGSIIGQLFGGSAACSGTDDNGQNDYYGRFDVSWDNGETIDRRLQDWLDPFNTGIEQLQALPPIEIPERDLGVRLRINPEEAATACDFPLQGRLQVILNNLGKTSMDSFTVTWGGDSIIQRTFTPTMPLDSGLSITLLDTIIPLGQSIQTFFARIHYNSPTNDLNPSNDSMQVTYDSQDYAVPVVRATKAIIDIRTDEYGGETTWELVDGSGTVAASGGPYTSLDRFLDTVNLEKNGCYTFTIFDSSNDGICCIWGEGSYVLHTDRGDTLNAGGQFTSSESTTFRSIRDIYDAGFEITVQDADENNCFEPSQQTVSLYVINLGDSTLTNISGLWQVNNENEDTFFVPELRPNTKIQLTQFNLTSSDQLRAEITAIDIDDYSNNNQRVFQIPSGFEGEKVSSDSIIVEIHTDEWPDQISWDIIDESGNVVASSPSYTQQSEVIRTSVFLQDLSCYTFTITDESCDGIDNQNGYRLLDEADNLIATNSSYACSDEVDFYSEKPTSISTTESTNDILVFPNPSIDQLTVSPTQQSYSLTLYDAFGLKLKEQKGHQMQIAEFPAGMYFLHIKLKNGANVFRKLQKL